MEYVNKDALVGTAWLAAHLKDPNLRVVDASWYLPTLKRDPKGEYATAHIPGSVFFDIDEIADTSSPLPHMLPSAEKFSARMRALGIGDADRVIVYDGGAMSSAARAWWTFRVFGHEDIAVLDGGFAKWQREGRRIESAPVSPKHRHFRSRLNPALVRDVEQVRENIETREAQLLDARPAGRFAGSEPEPRAGLRGGHIPGSLNLPSTLLIDPETGTLKPADALARLYDEAGIDRTKPIVTSCGSGVTASLLAFGLYLLGRKDVAVYDGSWSEWGSRQDTPIETGPGEARRQR